MTQDLFLKLIVSLAAALVCVPAFMIVRQIWVVDRKKAHTVNAAEAPLAQPPPVQSAKKQRAASGAGASPTRIPLGTTLATLTESLQSLLPFAGNLRLSTQEAFEHTNSILVHVAQVSEKLRSSNESLNGLLAENNRRLSTLGDALERLVDVQRQQEPQTQALMNANQQIATSIENNNKVLTPLGDSLQRLISIQEQRIASTDAIAEGDRQIIESIDRLAAAIQVLETSMKTLSQVEASTDLERVVHLQPGQPHGIEEPSVREMLAHPETTHTGPEPKHREQPKVDADEMRAFFWMVRQLQRASTLPPTVRPVLSEYAHLWLKALEYYSANALSYDIQLIFHVLGKLILPPQVEQLLSRGDYERLHTQLLDIRADARTYFIWLDMISPLRESLSGWEQHLNILADALDRIHNAKPDVLKEKSMPLGSEPGSESMPEPISEEELGNIANALIEALDRAEGRSSTTSIPVSPTELSSQPETPTNGSA